MDQDTVILFIKRYLLVSIGAIVLTAATVFFFSYTFYHITADNKDVSVRIVRENGKVDEAGKFLWFHVIPKDTVTLKVESVESSPVPKSEYVKSMTSGDTGIGFRTLHADFAPQHDLATNGEEMDTCTAGEYPRIYQYTCGGSSGVTILNAANPVDNGDYLSLPPPPIDVFSGMPVIHAERQLGVEPYQKGLLLLVADEIQTGSGLKYENPRLKYLNQQGEMTEIALPRPLETSENGRYRLITDRSGSEQFAIIDYTVNSIDLYDSVSATPKTIRPTKPFTGIGSALLCSLNKPTLLCYSGLAGDYTDSHDENEASREALDGNVEIYSTTSGEKTTQYKVPKDKAIESVCIDENQRVYTLHGDVVELATEHRGEIRRQPIITGVTQLECGKTTYFVSENRLYGIRDDNEFSANLVFASDHLSVMDVRSFGSSLFISGSFRSNPTRLMSFTAQPTTMPWQHERIADVAGRVIGSHKELGIDVRFSSRSLDYRLPARIDPNSEQAKRLVEDSKKSDGVTFTPSLHRMSD